MITCTHKDGAVWVWPSWAAIVAGTEPQRGQFGHQWEFSTMVLGREHVEAVHRELMIHQVPVNLVGIMAGHDVAGWSGDEGAVIMNWFLVINFEARIKSKMGGRTAPRDVQKVLTEFDLGLNGLPGGKSEEECKRVIVERLTEFGDTELATRLERRFRLVFR